ncbi:putative ubiquitin-like-specific protease 2A [Apium graveolens]|uniref:putative ubiquitin-like-specific protease 2A n=1 Tax=Apium graveolens TaxID=4045 RepID=UPI003D7B895D
MKRKMRNKEGQPSTNNFDIYLRGMWKIILKNKIAGCTFIYTLWFKNYMSNTCNSRTDALRWISNEKVFEKRYVFIPMCEGGHWNLLILCNLDKTVDSKTRPCLLLLDSLQSTISDKHKAGLQTFVKNIYKEDGRVGAEAVVKYPFGIPKVPQQTDGSKCGQYVLYYIYKFLMCCPQNYNWEEDYPGFVSGLQII